MFHLWCAVTVVALPFLAFVFVFNSFGLYFVVYESIIERFGKSDTVSFYAGGFAGVAVNIL